MFDNDNYNDNYVKKNNGFDKKCMMCGSPNIVKARFQIPNTNITRYTCNNCKEDFSVFFQHKKPLD